MSGELKPCPFCGGEAQLMTDELNMDCKQGTPMCMDCYAAPFTDEWRKAIKAWNTRQTLERPVVDVEVLKLNVEEMIGFNPEDFDIDLVKLLRSQGWDECIDHLAERGYLSTSSMSNPVPTPAQIDFDGMRKDVSKNYAYTYTPSYQDAENKGYNQALDDLKAKHGLPHIEGLENALNDTELTGHTHEPWKFIYKAAKAYAANMKGEGDE